MNNDFIEYPKRRKVGQDICKCMHIETDHNLIGIDGRECIVCLCKQFDKSEMNNNIMPEIVEAMNNAKPRFNVKGYGHERKV